MVDFQWEVRLKILGRILYILLGALFTIWLTPNFLRFKEIEFSQREACKTAFFYGCIWSDKAFSPNATVLHKLECGIQAQVYRYRLDEVLGRPGE